MRKNTIIIHCVASGKKLKRICGHIHISGIVLRLPSDSEIPHRWISLLAYPVFLPSFPGTDFPGEYPHHGPDSRGRRFHHRERLFGPADHSRKPVHLPHQPFGGLHHPGADQCAADAHHLPAAALGHLVLHRHAAAPEQGLPPHPRGDCGGECNYYR